MAGWCYASARACDPRHLHTPQLIIDVTCGLCPVRYGRAGATQVPVPTTQDRGRGARAGLPSQQPHRRAWRCLQLWTYPWGALHRLQPDSWPTQGKWSLLCTCTQAHSLPLTHARRRFKLSFHSCPEGIFWTAEPFVTKLDMMIHHCKPECYAQKLCCYSHDRGHIIEHDFLW